MAKKGPVDKNGKRVTAVQPGENIIRFRRGFSMPRRRGPIRWADGDGDGDGDVLDTETVQETSGFGSRVRRFRRSSSKARR